MLARVERKNDWQLAEELGDETPTNLQHFIARAERDAEQVRDDLRDVVVEQLGEADGVLIIDETTFLKKGVKSLGVKRQYSGTAGRVENCQIGVFLAARTTHGSAFLDRALYLPRERADERERRAAAKVPPESPLPRSRNLRGRCSREHSTPKFRRLGSRRTSLRQYPATFFYASPPSSWSGLPRPDQAYRSLIARFRKKAALGRWTNRVEIRYCD